MLLVGLRTPTSIGSHLHHLALEDITNPSRRPRRAPRRRQGQASAAACLPACLAFVFLAFLWHWDEGPSAGPAAGGPQASRSSDIGFPSQSTTRGRRSVGSGASDEGQRAWCCQTAYGICSGIAKCTIECVGEVPGRGHQLMGIPPHAVQQRARRVCRDLGEGQGAGAGGQEGGSGGVCRHRCPGCFRADYGYPSRHGHRVDFGWGCAGPADTGHVCIPLSCFHRSAPHGGPDHQDQGQGRRPQASGRSRISPRPRSVTPAPNPDKAPGDTRDVASLLAELCAASCFCSGAFES